MAPEALSKSKGTRQQKNKKKKKRCGKSTCSSRRHLISQMPWRANPQDQNTEYRKHSVDRNLFSPVLRNRFAVVLAAQTPNRAADQICINLRLPSLLPSVTRLRVDFIFQLIVACTL